MLVVRDGEPLVLTLSNRLRRRAGASLACGLLNGIAFPQLIVGEGGQVRVVEIGARVPAGQMADLVRHGTGVDLVEIVLLQALGKPVPDDVALPRFEQPLGIAFFTADPGPLRTGVVRSVGNLDPVREQPGVVQADSYIEVGETTLPVQLDIDRRGYVIATGDTGDHGLELARKAATFFQVDVEAAGL